MPAQPSFRIERINELIRRELVGLLKFETKDPRLQSVRITDVQTSRDLSAAKVFFALSADADKAEITPLLSNAAGFFRARLAKTVDLRHTPALKFIFDPAPSTGARIEDLLAELNQRS